MTPNPDQVKGIIERLATIALTWALAKGYITQMQMAEYLPLIVGVASVLYAWWINRPVALIQSAASVPNPSSPTGKTIVIAPKEIADNTPEGNIVGTADKAKEVESRK